MHSSSDAASVHTASSGGVSKIRNSGRILPYGSMKPANGSGEPEPENTFESAVAAAETVVAVTVALVVAVVAIVDVVIEVAVAVVSVFVAVVDVVVVEVVVATSPQQRIAKSAF